jgi:hypothetical protein
MKTQLQLNTLYLLHNLDTSNYTNKSGIHPHLILKIKGDELLILPLSTKPLSKYFEFGDEEEPSFKIQNKHLNEEKKNYFCLNHIKFIQEKDFFKHCHKTDGKPTQFELTKFEKGLLKSQFKKLLTFEFKDSFLKEKQQFLIENY